MPLMRIRDFVIDQRLIEGRAHTIACRRGQAGRRISSRLRGVSMLRERSLPSGTGSLGKRRSIRISRGDFAPHFRRATLLKIKEPGHPHCANEAGRRPVFRQDRK